MFKIGDKVFLVNIDPIGCEKKSSRRIFDIHKNRIYTIDIIENVDKIGIMGSVMYWYPAHFKKDE